MVNEGYEGQLAKAISFLVSGIVFLLLSLFLLFYMIPNTIVGSSDITNMANDSSLFPTLYTLAICLISLFLIAIGVKGIVKNKEHLCGKNLKVELKHAFLIDSLPLVIFALLGVLFCILASRLGFFASCWGVIFLATLYLKNRGIIWLGVFPVAMTAALWLVFSVLLSVRFPSGLMF